MTGVNLKRLAKRRIPIARWLPYYSGADALGDLVAGLTVGLTLIPQAIAYASLAGLNAQYGLYSSFAGSLIYIVFGTCREVNIGPTALISLLTFTYARGSPEYTALLCFLSGCVTIALGILRLGFLVEFVSTPVVSGFTSAASVIIACSQIKGLLGIKIQGDRFLDIWRELYDKIGDTRMPDLILSCCCIIVLLVLKSLKDMKISRPGVRRVLWFLGIGRNAVVVVITAGVSYYFEMRTTGGAPFLLTGHIEKGFPTVEPPVFTLSQGNATVTFAEMFANLGTGIVIVPLISLIGNVAIAKAFARGQTLDATQEMLTLGLCNIVGSFFHSMPVTGSFSRSAVNNASGVRTPMGGLYTGLLVILALTLLTPYFYYIPRATLSSVIICAVIFMVELSILQPIWRCSKRDILPTVVTFLACLFAGVELGILIGVAVDLAIVMYFNARPKIYIEYRNTTAACYILVRPSAGLQFPAVSYLKTHMTESLTPEKLPKNPKNGFVSLKVVLDCKHIDRIDFTALQGLSQVIDDLKNGGGYLILLNPHDDISRNLRAFVEDPILTAHSDFELVTILKQLDNEAAAAAAAVTIARYDASSEVIDIPNSRTKHSDNASTDL